MTPVKYPCITDPAGVFRRGPPLLVGIDVQRGMGQVQGRGRIAPDGAEGSHLEASQVVQR